MLTFILNISFDRPFLIFTSFFLFLQLYESSTTGFKFPALVNKHKTRILILEMASDFHFCTLWLTWTYLYTILIWLPDSFLLFIFTVLILCIVLMRVRSDLCFLICCSIFFFSRGFLVGRLKFRMTYYIKANCSRSFCLL